MTTKQHWMKRLAALFAAASFAASAGFAQSGGGFELTWSTFDGGGTLSAGGGFEVYGTVGQPDAGLHSGGGFEVTGGFWNFNTAAVPVELSAFTLE